MESRGPIDFHNLIFLLQANMIGKPICVILTIVIPFVSLDSQYLLRENVTSVPRSPKEYLDETKGLTCNDPMHNITYVLNPDSVGTSIGCFRETSVFKYCLEYNFKNGKLIIQPKLNAPCNDFSITPCTDKYFSPESYKFFECFELYGGISSPKEFQRKIDFLQKVIQELNKTIKERNYEIQNLQKETGYKAYAISFIVLFSILLVLFICFIIFHFRKESHPQISNSDTMQSTANGDKGESLMKSDDKEENRNEDKFELSYTGVNIPHDVNDMQLNEIMADVHVGKPNLPPMSKPRDKKDVEYPVSDNETY